MARRLGIVASGIALTLGVQACGTASAAGGSGPPPAPRSASVDDSELASRIESLGRGRFHDRYAGLESTDGGLIIYRTASSTEFDAAVHALAGSAQVVFRDAPYSAVDLDRLRDRVTGDIAYWQDHGIMINTVGSKHDGTAVEVGTQQVEQAQREFPQRYSAIPPIAVVSLGPIMPLVDYPTGWSSSRGPNLGSAST